METYLNLSQEKNPDNVDFYYKKQIETQQNYSSKQGGLGQYLLQEIKIQNCILSDFETDECLELLEKTLKRKTELMRSKIDKKIKDKIWNNRYKKIIKKLYYDYNYSLKDKKKINGLIKNMKQEYVEKIINMFYLIEKKNIMNYYQNNIFFQEFKKSKDSNRNENLGMVRGEEENINKNLKKITDSYNRYKDKIFMKKFIKLMMNDYKNQLIKLDKFLQVTKNSSIDVFYNRGVLDLNGESFRTKKINSNETDNRFYTLRTFKYGIWSKMNLSMKNPNKLMKDLYSKFLFLDSVQITTTGPNRDLSDNSSTSLSSKQLFRENKKLISKLLIPYLNKMKNLSSNDVIRRLDENCIYPSFQKNMKTNTQDIYEYNHPNVMRWKNIIFNIFLRCNNDNIIEYILFSKIMMYCFELFSINLTKKIIYDSMLKYISTIYGKKDNMEWVSIIFVTHFDFIFRKEIHYLNKDKIFFDFFQDFMINHSDKKTDSSRFNHNDKLKLIINQFYQGETEDNYEGYKNQDILTELKEIFTSI